MENSRNEQFLSFKLWAVLSSVTKFLAILLHPTQDVNHPFVQYILSLSHLVAISVIRSTMEVSHCLCSRHPYFTL